MNRRRFLQSSTALAASLAPVSSPRAADPAPRIVDTHTHFYDPGRPEGVPWPPKDSARLYRRVLPADWRAVAEPHGVRETVVVEASPWVEDNQWVLDLAAQDRSILGLVGNLDPREAMFAEHLKRFAANPLFRGLRWRADLVRIDEHRDQALAAARRMVEADLELDLNGPASLLPAIADLAKAVPDLRIVVNHLGGSGDPRSLQPGWLAGIRAVAAQPNVFMKVSALVEQVPGAEGAAPRDTAYYLPVLDPLWENFGPDRLIYGSNWPVSDRGAAYATVFGIVADYFGGKGSEAAEKYFWKNARAAYRWQERA